MNSLQVRPETLAERGFTHSDLKKLRHVYTVFLNVIKDHLPQPEAPILKVIKDRISQINGFLEKK